MEEGTGSGASSGAGSDEKNPPVSSKQVCAWWADSILLSTVKPAHVEPCTEGISSFKNVLLNWWQLRKANWKRPSKLFKVTSVLYCFLKKWLIQAVGSIKLPCRSLQKQALSFTINNYTDDKTAVSCSVGNRLSWYRHKHLHCLWCEVFWLRQPLGAITV